MEQWELGLTEPLPWEDPKQITPVAVEMEREQFDAFYAQVTGGMPG